MSRTEHSIPASLLTGLRPAVGGVQSSRALLSNQAQTPTSKDLQLAQRIRPSARLLSLATTPAWLSLILVVLAALVEPVSLQGSFMALENTDTPSPAPTRYWGIKGAYDAAAGKTFQVLFSGPASTSDPCTIQLYKTSFTNGSTSKSPDFTAVHCPASSLGAIIPSFSTLIGMVSMNVKTGKMAWINRVSPTTCTVTSPTMTASGFTGTSTVSTPATTIPTASVFDMGVDVEGTSKVLYLYHDATTISGLFADLSGAIPTLSSPATFANPQVVSTIYIAYTIQSKSRMIFHGFKLGLPPSFYLFCYDVYSSPTTFALKALWKSSTVVAMNSVADNLNGQDLIYVALVDTAASNAPYFAVLKLSAFEAAMSGTTPLLTDIYSGGVTGYKTATTTASYVLMFNCGVLNYLLTINTTPATTNTFLLFPKVFSADFGKNGISFNLPATATPTSVSYAYGFFRYGVTEAPSLYYQKTAYTDPIAKLRIGCGGDTPYIKLSDFTCYGDPLPSGYRKDTTAMTVELCITANCDTCPASAATCTNCKAPYQLISGSCVNCSAAVANCKVCETATTCKTCNDGYLPDNTGTKCQTVTVVVTESKCPAQVYSVYNRDSQNAFVQLNRLASDFDLSAFTYTFIDQITGTNYPCKACSASPAVGVAKALSFSIKSDVELLSATLQASYPLSSVKSGSRLLQITQEQKYEVITVENLSVKAEGNSDNDEMAHQAFTGINAIRFFATLILGFFSSPFAFWSTSVFSWLQLWALLPGRFLSYPDRFLTWHYKWYLLVVDFGDPFTNFRDWIVDGTKCVASDSYPTSKLGCSFVDNFGQNFVIIACILAFCLVMTGVVMLFKRKQANKIANASNQSASTSSVGVRMFLLNGLGLTYFFRFMDAIQPSLLFFSLLQFNTYFNSPNLGASVFFAVIFFAYYVVLVALATLLAFRLWKKIKAEGKQSSHLQLLQEMPVWLSFITFNFTGFKEVNYMWQLLWPLVEFARALLVSIFLVALKKDPSVALGLILAVEILRATFVAFLHKVRISWIYAVQDYVASGLYILYILLKLSTNGSMNEEQAQTQVGWAMAFIWVAIWCLILVSIVIEMALVTIRIILTCKNSAQTVKAGHATHSSLKELPASELEEHNAIKTTTALNFDEKNGGVIAMPLESPAARSRSVMMPSTAIEFAGGKGDANFIVNQVGKDGQVPTMMGSPIKNNSTGAGFAGNSPARQPSRTEVVRGSQVHHANNGDRQRVEGGEGQAQKESEWDL